MRKSQIFLYSCLAFVAGVALRTFLPESASATVWLIGFGLFFIITGFFPRKLAVFGILSVAVALGIFRFERSVPVFDNTHISSLAGEQTELTGVIMGEPDIRKNHVKYTVKADQYEGLVLLNAYLYPRYKYGDKISFSCQIKKPEPIEDFSYDRYLARYGIYALCSRPRIELIDNNQGNPIFQVLYGIKAKFVYKANQLLHEPQASFLAGILIGAKQGIPERLMEAFNRTGTTHIIALSGFNITIIAQAILIACKSLGLARKKSFWVSCFLIACFVLLTGAQASILRAGIMGILVLLAGYLGRRSRVTNALVFAGTAMVIINPKVLVDDAGFQLSFLATAGLIYVLPHLEKITKWIPSFFSIRESFSATISATLMTLPLIIFQFGRLSIVAPLVNVLILPMIPISMALGFVVTLIGLVSTSIGRIAAWSVWATLEYIVQVVEYFAQLEFASFDIPDFPNWSLAAMYGVPLIFVFLLKKNAGKKEKNSS